jgi:hypothetical protein
MVWAISDSVVGDKQLSGMCLERAVHGWASLGSGAAKAFDAC